MKELPELELYETLEEYVDALLMEGWKPKDLRRLVQVGLLTQAECDKFTEEIDQRSFTLLPNVI